MHKDRVQLQDNTAHRVNICKNHLFAVFAAHWWRTRAGEEYDVNSPIRAMQARKSGANKGN